MSKELYLMKGTGGKEVDLSCTEYYGGVEKGLMLQLTQGFANLLDDPDEPGFIQLTYKDAEEVIDILSDWLLTKEGT